MKLKPKKKLTFIKSSIYFGLFIFVVNICYNYYSEINIFSNVSSVVFSSVIFGLLISIMKYYYDRKLQVKGIMNFDSKLNQSRIIKTKTKIEDVKSTFKDVIATLKKPLILEEDGKTILAKTGISLMKASVN